MANKTPTTAPKAKKVPQVTRQQFRDKAPASIAVKLHDGKMELPGVIAVKKEFETGSLGWYGNGKILVEIDGKPCEVQMGFNFTLIGSKELPK